MSEREGDIHVPSRHGLLGLATSSHDWPCLEGRSVPSHLFVQQGCLLLSTLD